MVDELRLNGSEGNRTLVRWLSACLGAVFALLLLFAATSWKTLAAEYHLWRIRNGGPGMIHYADIANLGQPTDLSMYSVTGLDVEPAGIRLKTLREAYVVGSVATLMFDATNSKGWDTTILAIARWEDSRLHVLWWAEKFQG